ncbi:hypothetical protein VE03_09174 [Pseudogymnoascus sp. 23342-1-I1]|nr:hypothetical protein VE03_09174 [Pseudogymnoascus sp. 23342-1-I1]
MVDVGKGRDVEDVKWKIRWNEEWVWDIAVYPRGSISDAFERTDEFRFDSLLTEQDFTFIFRWTGLSGKLVNSSYLRTHNGIASAPAFVPRTAARSAVPRYSAATASIPLIAVFPQAAMDLPLRRCPRGHRHRGR